jgi:hypothetical protein
VEKDMFKIAAVLGLVAGGAGYAVYEYTDLFGSNCGSCSQSSQDCTITPVAVTPSCCETSTEGALAVSPCCSAATKVSAVSPCCAAKTNSIAANAALSFHNPYLAVALIAREACAEGAQCCTSNNASAAVAGVAAVAPVK